jgi:hypothetical protein
MRNGQGIYNNLCDKLKVYIDVNQSYTTTDLVNIMRTKPEFILEDMIAWVTGNTDLFNHTGKEAWAVGVLNQFLIDNPCNSQFPIPTLEVGQKDKAQEFYKYYYFCSDEEKAVINQKLCDAFTS